MSGEHEARHHMIGRTIVNVVYQIDHGKETMWIELDDGYAFCIKPKILWAEESERIASVHLAHSIANELCGQ